MAKNQPTPGSQAPSALDRAFLTDLDGVTELLLVRHGQQELPNPETATVGDWVNPPLSATGEAQAKTVGAYYSDHEVHAVYASPLARALDTGKAIADHHGLDLVVLEELREVALFGKAPQDQRPSDYLSPHYLNGLRERFVHDRRWTVYPHSESGEELRQRVVGTLFGIAASHPGERVVVACHGGVINAWFADVLGVAEDMFFRPGHASTSTSAVHSGRRVIRTLNEVHYLAAADPALVTY